MANIFWHPTLITPHLGYGLWSQRIVTIWILITDLRFVFVTPWSTVNGWKIQSFVTWGVFSKEVCKVKGNWDESERALSTHHTMSYNNENISLKRELPALLPLSFKKEKQWREAACRRLPFWWNFYGTLHQYMVLIKRWSCLIITIGATLSDKRNSI